MNEITRAIVVALVGLLLISVVIWRLVRARKRQQGKSVAQIHEQMVKELEKWGILFIVSIIILTIWARITTGRLNFSTGMDTFLLLAVMASLLLKTEDAAMYAMYGTLLVCSVILDGLWFFLFPGEAFQLNLFILILLFVFGRLIFAWHFFRQFAWYRKNQLSYIEQAYGEGSDRQTLDPEGVKKFVDIGIWGGAIAFGATVVAIILLLNDSTRAFLVLFNLIARTSPVGIAIGIASWLSDFQERQEWATGGVTGGLALIIAVIGFLAGADSILNPPRTTFHPPSQTSTPRPTLTSTATRTPAPPTPTTPPYPTALPSSTPPPSIPYTMIHGAAQDASHFSLDFSNNNLIIGEFHGTEYLDSGSVYIYALNPDDGTWSLEAELTAPDSIGTIGFGTQVAIDDNIAIASTKHAQDSAANDTMVYLIFDKQDNEWRYHSQIEIPFQHGDHSLDMSAQYIVVGQPERSYEAPDGSEHFGVVEIFRRQGDAWVSDALLYAPESEFVDHFVRFGSAVAIDENTVAISSADLLRQDLVGAVFIYQRDPAAGWVLKTQQEFEASDYDIRRAYAPLVLKGSTVVVGNTNPTYDQGDSLLVIDDISDNRNWGDVSITELKPEMPLAYFGYHFAFDGQNLIVASSSKFHSARHLLASQIAEINILHIYQRDPDNPTDWISEGTLKLTATEQASPVQSINYPMILLDNILIYVGAYVEVIEVITYSPHSVNAVELPVE